MNKETTRQEEEYSKNPLFVANQVVHSLQI